MSDTLRTDACRRDSQVWQRSRQLERELSAAQAALAQVNLDKAEFDALKAKLARYEAAGREIPKEWITELLRRLDKHLDVADEEVADCIRRLRDYAIAQKVRADENERDIIAYRGALGYSIPGDHDGKLNDGTTPKCGLCVARNLRGAHE